MSQWYENYGIVSETGQPAPKQEAGKKLSWEQFSKGLARQIEQGLSFGFADEIEAFISSKIKGVPYEEELAGIRGEMAGFREAKPKTALATEIGASMALPGGVSRTMAGRMGTGAAGGAVYGAGVSEGDIGDRVSGAVAGGVSGALLPFVGAGASESAKRLLDIGVPLTPGQAGSGLIGSAVRGIEEAVGTVPVAGSAIKAARQETIRKFGTGTFNEALKPILKLGAKPIPLTKTPRQAAIDAESQISSAYSTVYGKMKNTVTLEDMHAAIDDAAPTALDKLSQKQWANLREQLRGIVQRRAKDGQFTPESWKKAHSIIRDEAVRKKGKKLSDLAEAEGEVMSEVQDAIFERMIAKNPDVAEDIKSLGKSYRMFTTLDELVRKKDIEEAGTFLPSQLVSAVRRDPYASARQMRELDVPLQKTARAGQDILPSQLPSSGTAEREIILRSLGYGGAAAGVGAGAYYDPQATAIGLGGLGAAGLLGYGLYNPRVRPFTRGATLAAGQAASTPAAAGLLGQQFVD
ncbi:DNA ejection protein [Phage C72C1]|nr:DNA ejection protein [Phage C72C1]